MAHEHRVTIDAHRFALLVSGEPIPGNCACGEPVAVLLDDIGLLAMSAAIQGARAARAQIQQLESADAESAEEES